LKIYIGHLNFNSTKETLEKLFGQYGAVKSVDIVEDRGKGRSRGFGFIDMPNDKEAEEAIKNLNGADVDGWSIKVNKADDKRPGADDSGRRPPRPREKA
jgi:RNA recognition motif-containing protein